MGGLFHEGSANLATGLGHTEAANEAAREATDRIGELQGPANRADGLVAAVGTVYAGAREGLEPLGAGHSQTVDSLKAVVTATVALELGVRAASGLLAKSTGLRTAVGDYRTVAGLDSSDGDSVSDVAQILGRAGTESYRATTRYHAAMEGADPDELVPLSGMQRDAVETAQGAASVAGSQAARRAEETEAVRADVEKDAVTAARLQQQAAKFLARSLALAREAEEIGGALSALRQSVGRNAERLAMLTTADQGGALGALVGKAKDEANEVAQAGLRVKQAVESTQQRMPGGY